MSNDKDPYGFLAGMSAGKTEDELNSFLRNLSEAEIDDSDPNASKARKIQSAMQSMLSATQSENVQVDESFIPSFVKEDSDVENAPSKEVPNNSDAKEKLVQKYATQVPLDDSIRETNVPPKNYEINQLVNENREKRSNKSNNPLLKSYRAPKLSIKLASDGYMYAKGDIEWDSPETKEIDIYSTTAADELAMNNPDLLLNGTALKKLITSCAPAIKNVDRLLTPDFEIIMLAIRSASKSDELMYTYTCGECEHVSEHKGKITNLLNDIDHIHTPAEVVISNGIRLIIFPYDFVQNNLQSIKTFEEKSMMKMARNIESDDDKEKADLIAKSLEKIYEISRQTAAASIRQGILQDGEVITQPEFIEELVDNLSVEDYTKVNEAIEMMNNKGIQKYKTLQCPNCGETIETNIRYDPSELFAYGF